MLKLFGFFVIIMIFLFSENSYAQKKQITLNLENITIEGVLNNIEKKTDYRFIYKIKDIKLNDVVNIRVENMAIEFVLDKLFLNFPIKYIIRGKQIILKKGASKSVKNKDKKLIKPRVLRVVMGTVKNQEGLPLSGANIQEKGTNKGAQTDFDGNFSIEVTQENALLEISFIGFLKEKIRVENMKHINIVLQKKTEDLDEIMIAAFGISKVKKSLTYASQELKEEDINKVKHLHLINSLSGKSAGIIVKRSASGIGGALKVTLRGNSSTTNNDPLYVIDGVPLANSGNGQNGSSGFDSVFGAVTGNRDGGDIISLMNPNDITNISVLKGASAAALYGSQGSNGVILITTKKGKERKLEVTMNSNLTVDRVFSLPELQVAYQSPSVGQPIGLNGNVINPQSWGVKTSGLSNTIDDFFNTGFTFVKSVSLSAGTHKTQTYLSFANTQASGVIPENKLLRNNFNIKETASFLNDRIMISANVNLSDQRIKNRPVSGLASNPLPGLYVNPVGIDLNHYKENFEYFNPVTNMMEQFASTIDNIQENPYWIIYREPSKDIVQRVMTNLSFDYMLTKTFSLKSIVSYDKSFFNYDKRFYASSNPTEVAPTGRYILETTTNTQQYADLIATYAPNISKKLSITSLIGTSFIKSSIGDQTYLDSGKGGLVYPNSFTIANFADSRSIYQKVNNREVQSLFGSVNFGFKDKLFLDITGRTDWSSTLVNTDFSSFFYPSVGITGVLSEMIRFSEIVSFAKLRFSYAEVGKDLPVFVTSALNRIGEDQNTVIGSTVGLRQGETLKPERQKGVEFGTEWRFFKNRLGMDFTYYNSSTSDQIFFITAEPNVKGYSQNIVNAGEITNEGIELIVKAKPFVNTEGFNWTTIINYSKNKNRVVSVHPDLNNREAIINLAGAPNGYGYSLIEGEDYGSIRGFSVERNEQGIPLVTNDNGNLTLNTTAVSTIAHAQPNFTIGWKNSFSFKNLFADFLIDAKVGGQVVSVTEAINDFYGVSQATADARSKNDGKVHVIDQNGDFQQMTARNYYTTIGGRDGLLGEYVYNATNINLREASIGYNMFFKECLIDMMQVSLIANNVFFLLKKAPFDSNITSSTGIGLQGVDIYNQPTSKSIGLNINIKF
ncbi:SusC/RagA family TonB-linked outer membrane protein [Aquimarina sediminis]|uniref:SusC/RagA family TonB-linked outer membrane protein n=1 Tax=Aquimarina sediminis TaxID=2070536 RepID=UPI0013E8BF5D|nr:SusC/RagA family TonB-linked outer membrane protein [Aquimarina sediminis]